MQMITAIKLYCRRVSDNDLLKAKDIIGAEIKRREQNDSNNFYKAP